MTKTKSRPKHKPQAVKRVPIAAGPVAVRRTAASIIGANKPVPVPVIAQVAPPTSPVIAPTVAKATDLYQGRGGRMWFQMAATDAIRMRADILRVKAGARTMNDLAAMMFEALCDKHGV